MPNATKPFASLVFENHGYTRVVYVGGKLDAFIAESLDVSGRVCCGNCGHGSGYLKGVECKGEPGICFDIRRANRLRVYELGSVVLYVMCRLQVGNILFHGDTQDVMGVLAAVMSVLVRLGARWWFIPACCTHPVVLTHCFTWLRMPMSTLPMHVDEDIQEFCKQACCCALNVC